MKKIALGIAALVALNLGLGFSAYAADKVETGYIESSPERVSMTSQLAGMRSANMTTSIKASQPTTDTTAVQSSTTSAVAKTASTISSDTTKSADTADATTVSCRDSYRECMDEICLQDESSGGRCICSDNYAAAKTKMAEIADIVAESQKLNTESVERELAGTQAALVFGDNEKKQTATVDYLSWLSSDTNEDTASLDYDSLMGSALYAAAQKSCASRLALCGNDADREELLYSRMIANNCKAFSDYLDETKKYEEQNKLLAEKAVRAARTKMLDTTNKYNRGECLIAFRACVADKGGCGSNFENCLDASLLTRRANACDNILDQCNAVRDYVKQDWEQEAQSILITAAQYADTNKRATCRARTWDCLENSCGAGYSTGNATSSQCLNSINVAVGICPVITECEEIVPGFKSSINDDLKSLRARFCQNDIDKCLQEKCGSDYSSPVCLGKSSSDILAMCPQDMFSACKSYESKQFNAIVSAAMLQMDYQMVQGCVNHFSEQLGKVCGTDMSCLSVNPAISNMTSTSDSVDWRAYADESVDNFFVQFEKDMTVTACKDSIKPVGQASMGSIVFQTAKLLAKYQAEDRAFRAYTAKITELSQKEDIETARANCDKIFANAQKSNSTSGRSTDEAGVWVTNHVFQESLRNCKLTKVQKVCEIGGETKGAAALKTGAGGLAAGASLGTMASPGWGSLIGGAVGLVGGVIGGIATGGEETSCQEIIVEEDIAL